jgi:hypothetical protein
MNKKINLVIVSMDPKPWNEWTKDSDDIPRHLDPYPIVRRAVAGTIVLIAEIIEHNLWVASLGDFEGCESN